MNKELKDFIVNSILQPYLVHVEFEVLNILTEVENNKLLREFLHIKGCNLITLKTTIKRFIERIQQVINLMKI